ncbi:hypothetical protein [Streptomyces tremellae]|uniref:hypothetical protein n=1 Tax=Streptomyces tremellae TaxID=1124239 RepID=UPI0031EB188F
MRQMWRAGALLLVLASTVVGCEDGGGNASGGDGRSQGSAQVGADRVCHGALSAEGVKALGVMTAVKKYAPDDVRTDPARAVAELVASYVPGTPTDPTTFTQEAKGRACKVTPAGGPLWDAEVDLSFVAKENAKGTYRLGPNVAYADEVMAELYFPCQSPRLPGNEDGPLVVKAALRSSPHSGKRTPGSAAETERLRRANLTFLNSVAYAAAKSLRCSGNGGVRQVAAVENAPSPEPPNTSPPVAG